MFVVPLKYRTSSLSCLPQTDLHSVLSPFLRSIPGLIRCRALRITGCHSRMSMMARKFDTHLCTKARRLITQFVCQVRHYEPVMCRTCLAHSIACICLPLNAGEMYLVLDNEEVLMKQGDVCVQRATNHAWKNISDKPCVMAFVLIDHDVNYT
jgi:hypothetical protein